MSETHVTAETLQRLERRELDANELLKVVRHLGRCSECGRAADASVPSRLTLDDETGDEPEHLDVESQLFPWVDGTIDSAGREIVVTHLEDCAVCRAEAEDLRRLREPRRRFGRRRWKVAAAGALVAGATLVTRRPPTPDPPPPVRTVTRASSPVPYANGDWNALVAEAIRTGRLPMAGGLDELRPAADPLRGDGESTEAGPLSPAGIVVATARPRFTWPAANGDAKYVVSVFDGGREVATSEALTTTNWTPSSDLPAERTLAWQVDVTRGARRFLLPAPPAPPALFRIASAADRAAIDDARAQYPNDHLLLAVLYARAGLAAEADAALLSAVTTGDRRAANIARAR